MNWYGTYGIGINRPVAKKHGCSPVLYIHSKSPNYPKGSSLNSLKWFENFAFTKYLKQVRGKQIFFDNKDIPYWKWKTFYNEREWRFFSADKKIEVIQYKKETELEDRRRELNSNALPYLEFDHNWIEYILIRDYNDMDSLIKVLKTPKYKKNYESLLTKVITFKQIQKDF